MKQKEIEEIPQSYLDQSYEDLKHDIRKALERLDRLNKFDHLGKVYVIPGIINLPLHEEVTGNIVVGGNVIPAVVLAEQDTGNLHFYALKQLLNDFKELDGF